MDGIIALIVIIGIVSRIMKAVNKNKTRNSTQTRIPPFDANSSQSNIPQSPPPRISSSEGDSMPSAQTPPPQWDTVPTMLRDAQDEIADVLRDIKKAVAEKADNKPHHQRHQTPSAAPTQSRARSTLTQIQLRTQTGSMRTPTVEEGECPPEHDSLHPENSIYASGMYIPKKGISTLRTKARLNAQQARQGIIWAEVLKRPKPGVAPRFR